MPGIIETPSPQRQEEFLQAVARSRALHRPWVSPPQTIAEFTAYLHRVLQPSHVGYWVRTPANELAGVININEITITIFTVVNLFASRRIINRGLLAPCL